MVYNIESMRMTANENLWVLSLEGFVVERV